MKKFFFLILLIVCFIPRLSQAQDAASAVWPLSANQTPTLTGSVTAESQLLNNMQVYYQSSVQRSSPAGTAGTWPTNTGEVSDRYVQYALTPSSPKMFTCSTISMFIYVSSGSNGRANIYYSKDASFSSRTQIGSTISLTTTVPTSANVTVSPNINVFTGETLYVRVYPWYTSATTTKYVITKNLTISGNTYDPTAPTVDLTTTPTLVLSTSATGTGGRITATNNSYVTASGVCWNTTGTPTVSDNVTTNGGTTNSSTTYPYSFSTDMTGLTPGATYYVRAYATNGAGTGYGPEISFTTSSSASTPTVTTSSLSAITQNSASGGGNITVDGGASVTARGVCWNTSGSPTIADNFTDNGTGTGSFTSSITGLSAGTKYYVRAYATNSVGTAYGAELEINTLISYYNKPDADIALAASWGTATDGTGSSPADFSTVNATYYITNSGATLGSALTIGASGTKIILGDGTNAISFTIPTDYAYSGNMDVLNNAVLQIRNTTGLILGTLTAGSTVNYDGNGSLTILSANYSNLGSTNDTEGSRTFSTSGNIGVSGSFTAGSAAYTVTNSTVVFNGSSAQTIGKSKFYNLTISNNSVISSGDTLTITSGGTLVISSSKSLTVNGTIDNQSANAVTMTGSLTVASGATYLANVAGTRIPSATYQSGSTLKILNSIDGSVRLPASIGGNLVVDFNGALNAWTNATTTTIGGDFTLLNGSMNNGTGGSYRTLIVNGNMYVSGGQYDIAGTAAVATTQTLTVLGNLTISGGKLYASNNATVGTVGTINIGGNLVHTGGEIGQSTIGTGAKIVFNGTGVQSVQSIGFANNPAVTFNNTYAGAGITLAADLQLNSVVTFTSGVVALGDYHLTLGSTAIISGSPSASAMIYVNGTGELRKTVTAPVSGFVFPIGDISGTNEYAPVTVNISADAYSSAYVYVKTYRSKHPNNSSVSDYLNRYWTVSGSGFTNPLYSGTFAYPATNVQGNESIIYGAFYNGSTWTNVGTVSTSQHNFTTPNLYQFGAFTCADGNVVPATPVLTTSATGIYFGRVNRNTSSTAQTASITGYNLSPAAGNITVTAPTNFEVSLTNGSGYTSSVEIAYTSNSLSSTTVYIRFNAPNVTTTTMFNGTLTVAGGGATTQNINLSGKSIIPNAELGANIVVAADGSGDYTTWQAAINAIPSSHPEISPYVVYIRQGFYHEKVTIPATLSDLKFVGELKDSTILDYDDYVGMSGTPNVPGTNAVQTLQVNSSSTTFENLTVQNLVTVERAVAVNIGTAADKIVWRNCKILGHQDTYYFYNSYRVYHNNCTITGSVDYIFGNGTAVFDSCQLGINRNNSVLTAASTASNLTYGLVFRHCTIYADSIGFDSTPITYFYLGRPWNNNPKTVFLYCYEPSTLHAGGWTLMNSDPAATVNQSTLYAEYNCYGPGASPSTRNTISGNANYGRQLTELEASNYTLSNIFAAASKTDSPFPNGDWTPDNSTSPLPVELQSFQSRTINNDVTLTWETASEVNANHYQVERSISSTNSNAPQNWVAIGKITAAGNSNSVKQYGFTDKNLNSGKYQYRLKMVDNDGTFTYSAITEAVIGAPSEFQLAQNYPNPFNPSTKIEYAVPQSGKVALKIFTLTGQLVATLLDEYKQAGYYSIDFTGSNLSSGMYIYQLTTGNKKLTKKMIFLK